MRVAARHEVTSRWPRCSFWHELTSFLACANNFWALDFTSKLTIFLSLEEPTI
jgi:hypothetical protein